MVCRFVPKKCSLLTSVPRLTAVNAVQLAMALVSNVFLLLNMARRVKFSIAQPITIVGWCATQLLARYAS